MNQIILLRQTLKPLLGWHRARLNFLALFAIALLRVKTIDLAELTIGCRSNVKTDSSYKRLQRFFLSLDLDSAVVALIDIPQPWFLSTDRTEWSFGKKRFNILMSGVIHNGIACPVVWEMLEKKGNSHSDEGMDLLERFYSIFPDTEISYLTGDREFIRKSWLSYLLIEPTIPFQFRIRKSDRIDDKQKQLRAWTRMRPSRALARRSARIRKDIAPHMRCIVFSHLQPGQTQVLSGKKLVWERLVYISALRLDDGELLIVITPDSCSTTISDYGQLWSIETLFGIFKTKGFCLESTHFTDSERPFSWPHLRLSKLVALISLALYCAVKTGVLLHQNSPIKIKKHGRLAKSIFRYGLDYLRSIVTDLDLKQNEFIVSFKFLSCT